MYLAVGPQGLAREARSLEVPLSPVSKWGCSIADHFEPTRSSFRNPL
jgi:hypothetical protein